MDKEENPSDSEGLRKRTCLGENDSHMAQYLTCSWFLHMFIKNDIIYEREWRAYKYIFFKFRGKESKE